LKGGIYGITVFICYVLSYPEFIYNSKYLGSVSEFVTYEPHCHLYPGGERIDIWITILIIAIIVLTFSMFSLGYNVAKYTHKKRIKEEKLRQWISEYWEGADDMRREDIADFMDLHIERLENLLEEGTK